MTYYLDTSFAVTAFTAEQKTVLAQGWLEQHEHEEIYISNWTRTEFSSALSVKVRTGSLDLDNRAKVLADWHQYLADSVGHISVSLEDFSIATQFAERHQLSLRASDALHLAVAYGAGLRLVTFDRQLAKAALELGVSVAEVG